LREIAMTQVNLVQASEIIEEAFARGAALGLKPLSVAVVDAGGHLVAFKRGDGASILRPQIAAAKAVGALELGVSSRKIAEMAIDRPAFVTSLGSLSAGGVVPAAGGVIIVDQAGQPIGAVGVTGDTSDNDEICALAGIEAAGLRPQAGG